ncbi:MAG: CAP domain-containing protein [Enhygromyxa sp.]
MRRTPLAALLLLSACSEPEDPAPEVPAIPYCDEVASWDLGHAQFEREVLELVNQRRAEGADCGSGGDFLGSREPLSMDPALRCAARKHTLAMIASDDVEHESPEGETFTDRAAQAGYEGTALAQSIAGGSRDPARVVGTWMSNDGNCANLMNEDATELGVGYRPASGVTHAHYWTAVFGQGE